MKSLCAGNPLTQGSLKSLQIRGDVGLGFCIGRDRVEDLDNRLPGLLAAEGSKIAPPGFLQQYQHTLNLHSGIRDTFVNFQ